MKLISDVMFWISNGLLIPVIVGLIILFVMAVLMLGGLFGSRQHYRRRVAKYGRLFAKVKEDGTAELRKKLEEAAGATPFERVGLHLFTASEAERNYLIGNYELEIERRLSNAKILTKFGPILGLMGTLIPMGPALVGLSTGDISSMAYNMQVAFATTVMGMFASGVGYLSLQIVRGYNHKDLLWLDYLNDTLKDEQAKEI
ncbi:flagellar motor protein MotA [Porphyromonas macacae]|uniref:Flagellar motor protein MotA n=1 Tax=Porphyromonas macacae TaxID=28115 RepID=A0A0A2GDH5_9PORP|nr:MotA/TolQ/ExbB proton channel family protein [Porphyromonas macacae]KGN74753.1 flagellar motor protein MotA [Porphyromonas macacae]KGN98524.1 flagellar motor protein MotA [Porphyromonas macacae]